VHDCRHVRGNAHHVSLGYLTVTCTSHSSLDCVQKQVYFTVNSFFLTTPRLSPTAASCYEVYDASPYYLIVVPEPASAVLWKCGTCSGQECKCRSTRQVEFVFCDVPQVVYDIGTYHPIHPSFPTTSILVPWAEDDGDI
jgi:hypothetical protein